MPSTPRPKLPQYAPMIAAQIRQPFHRDGWVYEEKIDGYRMLAYKDGRTVRLESRNGVNHARLQLAGWDALQHAERNL